MASEPNQRLLTLDVIRGLAVMGIALMNVGGFALYGWATTHPTLGGGTDALNLTIWALEFVFVEHKMRGLFTLLFGASLLLFMQQAERRGMMPRTMVNRRLFWLFLFGVLHFVFLWSGDILAFYAIIGAIAVLFAHQRIKTLLVLAGLAFLLQALVWMNFTSQTVRDWDALNADDTPAITLKAIEKRAQAMVDPAAETISEDRAVYRGGYGANLQDRIEHQWLGQISVFKLYCFETFGLMLLGMVMLKAGTFSATAPPAALRRIANWSGTVGIFGMVMLFAWVAANNLHPFTTLLATLHYSLPFRVAMVIAYALLIAIWCQQRKQLSLKFRLAETGQMAFTNYIATSLIFGLIFYGYGLGLYERMDRAGQLMIVLGTCALMLVWSPWWMARFRHGPLEWLWRCLTRWEIVPLRRGTAREALSLG